MSASFTVRLEGLKKLIGKFESPAIKEELNKLPQQKGIAAFVGQAIEDNFDKEGPGWAPLKASTIRNSVKKSLRKKLSKLTDEQILRYERSVRRQGAEGTPNRAILESSGTLKKSVTTPGKKGNIWKQEGTNLVWGTDLVYAGIHNKGYPKRKVPKREFLKIRDEWKVQLNNYVIELIVRRIKAVLRSSG